MSHSIVITAAKRTAIGAFNGGLSKVPAHKLGAHVIERLLQDNKLDPTQVDEVIMGQVLTALQGQNPARQAAIEASIPEEKTAITINQVCGSGLRSVAMAMQSILCGDSDIVIAGGQENMSMAPHAAHLRDGVKFGDSSFSDTMIKDGLWDVFNDYHMGITAENIADKYGITRDEQDAFAAQSQQRAAQAVNEGRFKDEIIPIVYQTRKGDVTVEFDEHPRANTTQESLAGLRPAFKKEGTVTAGNASGLNDGAAAVVVMSETRASELGLKPLVKITSWATAGVAPSLMGAGPIPASQKALQKAGWSVSDLDLVESNEAFAAQACSVLRELDLDPEIVNVNGGAIALGHPIGASGTRVLVTLIHEMIKRDVKKGLATLCIGGGMGIAMCVER